MIVPSVRIWIAVSSNAFRKMVIDIFHPGEARAAIDAAELALCSLGFLRLFHAFPKDSAVVGPADPPHSAVTTWHLHLKSVYLK